MRMPRGGALRLDEEHPQLYSAAIAIIKSLMELEGALASNDEGVAWVHHIEFAQRAGNLADHLTAAVQLAVQGHYASSFAIVRTALEHTCLDELLLLASRYREILRVDDGTYERLHAEYESGQADWASSVITFERTKKGVSLVRSGYQVRDPSGKVVEQLSPYYPVIETHDALLGPPNSQSDVAEAFCDPEQLRDWARRNRTMYESYLRWSSIVDNLELNERLNPWDVPRLQAHYRFLSAFTHATGTGYETIRRQRDRTRGDANSEHILGELVLLYVSSIAVCELRAFLEFVSVRSSLHVCDNQLFEDTCRQVATTVSYMWFPRVGAPTGFDRFEEANRRAFDKGGESHPSLRPYVQRISQPQRSATTAIQ